MASYNRLNQEDITVSTDKVVTNAWSDDVNSLTTFFTSSTQAGASVWSSAVSTTQANFYIEVYKDDINLTSSVLPQFSVAYGHKGGSGSENFTNTEGALGNSATKCVYRQYAQLVYGDESSNFTFNGYEPNDIFVINVNRGRYKHALKLQRWPLVDTAKMEKEKKEKERKARLRRLYGLPEDKLKT